MLQVMDAEVPNLEHLASLSATQEYPNVTHYSISSVVDAGDLAAVEEVFTAGFANVTSPFSILLLDYIHTGAKSNNDTAYGWRGKYTAYVWSFWERTAAGSEADRDSLHVQVISS